MWLWNEIKTDQSCNLESMWLESVLIFSVFAQLLYVRRFALNMRKNVIQNSLPDLQLRITTMHVFK